MDRLPKLSPTQGDALRVLGSVPEGQTSTPGLYQHGMTWNGHSHICTTMDRLRMFGFAEKVTDLRVPLSWPERLACPSWERNPYYAWRITTAGRERLATEDARRRERSAAYARELEASRPARDVE